jgi:hypothetical protein
MAKFFAFLMTKNSRCIVLNMGTLAIYLKGLRKRSTLLAPFTMSLSGGCLFMLNKERLEKSADLRRGEKSAFWEDFDKTLQKQRVEVTFKMDGHFYPETMHSVGSLYLCEFTNKGINFFEFKPQSLNWKNSLRFKLTHVVDEIELIEVNTQKKLDLVMGILPSDSVTLEVKINFKNGQVYHLYSKSISVVEKIFEWCNNNDLKVKDEERIEIVFKESNNPIDEIKNNRINRRY